MSGETATATPRTGPSVLILGASGGTGSACVRRFHAHTSQPNVHAFCRTPSKLSTEDLQLCTSVQQGDAMNSDDLEKALQATNPDLIVVAIGTGLSKEMFRTQSARALIEALSKSIVKDKVHVAVVSSMGAGDSEIIMGWLNLMGKLISWILRHALVDHTSQEAAFMEALGQSRVSICRPTGLSDGPMTGNVAVFERVGPTNRISREDVAEWLAQHCLATKSSPQGGIFHITAAADKEK